MTARSHSRDARKRKKKLRLSMEKRRRDQEKRGELDRADEKAEKPKKASKGAFG